MHFLSCGGELNHHGKYMCDSMFRKLGNDYKRITTDFTNDTRKQLGYKDMAGEPYNIDGSQFGEEQIKEWISWADVIDYGSAPEAFLHEAVRQNKIVFIRIERLLKEGDWKLLVPSVRKKYHRKYTQYQNNKNVYFLCVSGYAASDLKKIGVFGPRVLQWAYSPMFVEYEKKEIKQPDTPLELFWCGRLISWKHPEVAVKIAELLNRKKIDYRMEIAGIGPLTAKIQNLIIRKHLQEKVKMIGAVPADRMRETMRSKDIFIATSDRNEGWGVVINEAMNSGCCVVASREMGAVPVLIEDGVNGYVFSLKEIQKAIDAIKEISIDRELLAKIGNQAYLTIKNNYSPNVYADAFVDLAKNAIEGKKAELIGLGEQAVLR